MAVPPLAVVLLSGGLDSTTTLAIAQSEGYQVAALSVRYGQRHQDEIQAAQRIARHMGAWKHLILDMDLRCLGGSALTADLEVPKHESAAQIGGQIPVTYVPARNTILLALALGWAEVLGSGDLFLGVNALDYSGYPDCRPEYIAAFQSLANLATKAAVEGAQRVTVHTPLIQLSKAEIIRKGTELGVNYSLTRSCYAPDERGRACGRCDACVIRLRGFAEAGIRDPAPYAVGSRE